MVRQLQKIRFSILVTMCLIALGSYLLVTQPLRQVLKKSIQQNYIYAAEGVAYTLDNFIEHSMYAAASLSGRSMIKQAMADYKNGRLSLAELQAYTRPEYEDGFAALENLTGAVRMMDNQIIAEQGTVFREKIENVREIDKITPHIDPAQLMLTIYSPIRDGEDIIGYDIVFVQMSALMHGVHENYMEHKIYSARETEENLAGKELIQHGSEGGRLASDGKVTWYVKPLKHTDFYFVASAPDRIIYNPLHSTLARVTFTLPVFIFFVIIVINNYAFGSIGKLAKKLEERKNWYKQAALTDQLTGVFSRRHFNEIFEQYLNGTVPVQAPLAIAMTDVNNFKHINDTYGHLTGDEVLREIACVLKTHVRSEDKVIRYGGDEFLLLLKDCTLETAEKVLSRVNKTLQANSKFNFPIEISYGISIIRGKEELPQAIQAADARMYKMKEKNKVQDNTTFDLLPPVPLKQPF